MDDDIRRGEKLYELAADGCAIVTDAAGEVIARQNLTSLYRLRGRFDASRQQADRAVAVAEASDDPVTRARGSVIRARQALASGRDIGGAHRSLLRAERLIFPNGPIGLRRTILYQLAEARLALGMLDEAIAALEQHQALRAEDGATVEAAKVEFNLLNLHLTKSEMHPQPGDRERLVIRAESSSVKARLLRDPSAEAASEQLLGHLLRRSDPERARRHLRRCLEREATLGHPELRARCLRSLSLVEGTRDPDEAARLSREAVGLVARSPGRKLLAEAWQTRLRLAWRTLPEERGHPGIDVGS